MTAPVRLACFYVAIFAVGGIQLPFWPVWLAHRQLAPADIGVLLAVGAWLRLATSPLAGIAADRIPSPRHVMLPLCLCTLVGFGLFLPARGFAAALMLNALTSGCLAALLPLGESVALSAASAGRLDYGRVRLWGSLGFIAATLLAGRAVPAIGEESVLYLLIGAAALLAAACAILPQQRQPAGAPGFAAASTLLRPSFVAFLAAAVLIQGSHAIYYAFGTLHWRTLGIGDGTIALLWVEGVVAEILLFYWGARLLRRFTPLGLIALGGCGGVLRWSVTAATGALPLLVLLQLLHALSFGAAHLGAMHHLSRTLPRGRAATGQALYATAGGVAQGLILLLAGPLYASAGGLSYLAMAALAGVGAGLSLAQATKC